MTDAELAALPPSAAAHALGRRILTAHARHGRVSGVLDGQPRAWELAARMLDHTLAAPGATLVIADARACPGTDRAALRLDVVRPDRAFATRTWLVLELTPHGAHVRASASALTRELLLGPLAGARAAPTTGPSPHPRPAPPADAIDAILTRLAATDPPADPP